VRWNSRSPQSRSSCVMARLTIDCGMSSAVAACTGHPQEEAPARVQNG